MAELGDIVGALQAMNRASGAIDAANLAASNDPQVQDTPGAPVGSGLANYYFQNNGGPLPPGLQNVIATKQASALQQVGQDYVNGTPDPITGKPMDQASALMKMGGIKGEDPSVTVSKIAYNRAMGWDTNPTPQAVPSNAMVQQAPALASMGGDVSSTPVAQINNPNAPPNGGGSALSQGFVAPNAYPALAASNGLLNGTQQPAQQAAPRTAAFMPPTGGIQEQPQPSSPQVAPVSNNTAAGVALQRPTAAPSGLSPQAMAAMNLSGGGIDPLKMVELQSTLQKNAADTASANATAAQKNTETPSNVAKAQAETAASQATAQETKSKTVFAPSGAPISDAQKDEDKQFGPAWGTFKNQGGSDQVRIANQAIDDALNKLRTGKVTSGGPIDALSTDAEGHPGLIGGMLNRPLISTKTEVDSAISPLLKPLFGARVTNFEASNLQRSLGIDPYAPTDLNITKLIRLKDKINSGAQALSASGNYFDSHGGTLAEYPGETSITQPNNAAPETTPQQVPPHMIYGTPDRAQALRDQLAKLQASKRQ